MLKKSIKTGMSRWKVHKRSEKASAKKKLLTRCV